MNRPLDGTSKIPYIRIVQETTHMDEEFLSRIVADIQRKTFYLHSSEGDTKVVACDDSEQFLAILSVCKEHCTNGELVFTP